MCTTAVRLSSGSTQAPLKCQPEREIPGKLPTPSPSLQLGDTAWAQGVAKGCFVIFFSLSPHLAKYSKHVDL